MNYHRWTRVAVSSSGLGFLLFVAISMTPSWSQSGNWSDQASPVTQHPMNGAIAPAQVATAGNSMMASVILANGFQQIVVVDHGKTTMAVYHVDPTRGDILLKSVRRMDADFALEEFNLSEPTPSTIRKNVR
ncbi:MAG: hypothetical protein WCK15_12550 [Pirellula sp.]|jgi:hypothetical protein